jgi:hypothetical protein
VRAGFSLLGTAESARGPVSYTTSSLIGPLLGLFEASGTLLFQATQRFIM